MDQTVMQAPKTRAEALRRMDTIAAAEAVAHNEHLKGPVGRQTVSEHWMFRAWRAEATLSKWPLVNGHISWTSGDTALTFLNQLDLPD